MIGWMKCALLSLQFRVKFDPLGTGRSMDLKKLLRASDRTSGLAETHMHFGFTSLAQFQLHQNLTFRIKETGNLLGRFKVTLLTS